MLVTLEQPKMPGL